MCVSNDFMDKYFDIYEEADHRFNFPVYRTNIVSANMIEVKVGTTGFCGGDSGHGGKTFVSLKDLASTDIKVNVIPSGRDGNGGVEIILGGDCELATFINALTFIKTKLEEKADETVQWF